MSNPHSSNVSRAFSPSAYARPTGATPTPQAPWRVRRVEWLRLLAPASMGGAGRRFELGDQHPGARDRMRDLARLIEEGLVVQEGKPRSRREGRRKYVKLTEAGHVAFLASQPAIARVARPYAKRRAALGLDPQVPDTDEPA